MKIGKGHYLEGDKRGRMSLSLVGKREGYNNLYRLFGWVGWDNLDNALVI